MHVIAGCALTVLFGVPAMTAFPASAAAATIATNTQRAVTPAAVLDLMQRVADWQLRNPSKHPEDDWTQGVGDTGLMALVGVSGEPRFLDAMLAMGERNAWKLGQRPHHADDHVVGQTYAELYALMREPKMIAAMRERFDDVMRAPHDGPLDWESKQVLDRWSWCDALFMSPPAWARLTAVTGDRRYLDFAIRQWWKTSDFLYDENEHLYARDSRFLTAKEANGKRVFWGRGNGWVMAGLVRMLQYIPADHPARPRFERQYKKMSERLLQLQQSDGMWRASLLDPASYPLQETSGTGLYAYALAYGVNQGLLERARFEPAVRKSWDALTAHVAADGKLTHVQPIGEDPKAFSPDATEVYGVGAFLLAGSEMYRMMLEEIGRPRRVLVSNTGNFHRFDELVEVPANGSQAVMDVATSRVVPSQEFEGRLLFPSTLAPEEKRQYLLLPRSVLPAVPPVRSRAHARFVPERLDDFAWESDRIAHRVYGPAIMSDPQEKLVSSGIDVWGKRTRNLVVDKWYASGDYHIDHGEGLDFYHVGQSRGCGGLGVYDGRGLQNSANFSKWKVLADGPLRAVFELGYDTWNGGGRRVSEVRRVSIDAGSNFSRMESRFTFTGRPLDVGVGIVRRAGDGHYVELAQSMSYWEPAHEQDGHIACAVILPGARHTTVGNQYVAVGQAYSGRPFIYYMGAGWSKSGDFPDAAAWEKYVDNYTARIDQPLKVTVVGAP